MISSNDTTRIIASVATVIATVLGSNIGLDVRNTERVSKVASEVGSVANQNKEILDGLQQLLDAKFAYATEIGIKNSELNEQIIFEAQQRMQLHEEELEMLRQMKKDIEHLKAIRGVK